MDSGGADHRRAGGPHHGRLVDDASARRGRCAAVRRDRSAAVRVRVGVDAAGGGTGGGWCVTWRGPRPADHRPGHEHGHHRDPVAIAWGTLRLRVCGGDDRSGHRGRTARERGAARRVDANAVAIVARPHVAAGTALGQRARRVVCGLAASSWSPRVSRRTPDVANVMCRGSRR